MVINCIQLLHITHINAINKSIFCNFKMQYSMQNPKVTTAIYVTKYPSKSTWLIVKHRNRKKLINVPRTLSFQIFNAFK